MATKIVVLNNGTPVSGATVIVGCLVGQAITTTVRGVADLSSYVATGFVGYTQVVIRKEGVVDAVTLLEIHEGETHTIDFTES